MAATLQPDPILAARVRDLVDRTTIASAARRLDLAEATVARLAGGMRCTQGTLLLAAERLRILDEVHP